MAIWTDAVDKMTTDKRCLQCKGPCDLVPRTKGTHYADIRCRSCGFHNGFAPKPDSDTSKYRRSKAHRDLVKLFSKGRCEMCLIKEDQLEGRNNLQAHHVVEHQAGGSSDRANIWILCEHCHSLVNWKRKVVRNWTSKETLQAKQSRNW